MLRIAAVWIVLVGGVGIAEAKGEEGPENRAEAVKRLETAKKSGWQLASIVAPRLEVEGPQADKFPGLNAFAADFRKLAATIDPKKPASEWPAFDVDALVSKNPNFWRAQYELAPADSGWMMLHAGLLMAAGEAKRCGVVLAFAESRNDVPKEIRHGMDILLGQANGVMASFGEEIGKGVAQFDAGDHAAALKTYRASLKDWPQNSYGHYEIGFTLMSDALAKQQAPHGPAVKACFLESRKHDPFQWHAYQGAGAEVLPKLQGIAQAAQLFEVMTKGGPDAKLSEVSLISLSEGLQAAEADELALAARQLVVQRRGRYDAADHPFFAVSLRRLAPGKTTEKILERLASTSLELRQLVAPEKEGNAEK